MAQVVAAHGVDGTLKCRVVTDFPDRFRRGAAFLVGDPPTRTRATRARLSGDHVFLKFEGVDSRDQAERLRGTDVLIEARAARKLPRGQFLWRDVIGLRVEDASGQQHGTVADVLRTGANDVYVVRGPAGEFMVPAIKDVVKLIEPEVGRLVIEPMPGLLPEPRAPREPRPRRRRPGP